MATVVLDNVSKSFPGGVTAVDRVSLEIRDREFVVLVGPSGCGKSTTLRMIAGLEEITAGTIAIDGRVVNDVAPKDRDLAMVFQNYALYPHMTVYKNMAFGLMLRKYPKAEIDRRVREAAGILGITDDQLQRKPKALSGGQRQRVAVGRAIVRHPKVFLFDEPLSNLDAKMRVQMRAEISKLHHRLQSTMIYVTHDQVEAMTMGDRIVVMKDGRVQQVDAPLALYERPANIFVAGFIGSPPMNFFRGRIAGGQFQADAGFTLPVTLREGEVVIGIRPEHLQPAATTGASLPAVVELVEPMGAETHVTGRIGGQVFVARFDSHRQPRVGDVVPLTVKPGAVHFFDPSTEAAIR